jgi:hypothetical protein
MAKVDEGKVLFETLKVKPLKELLLEPFKKWKIVVDNYR